MKSKIIAAKINGYLSYTTDYKLSPETKDMLREAGYTVEEFKKFEIISWEYR